MRALGLVPLFIYFVLKVCYVQLSGCLAHGNTFVVHAAFPVGVRYLCLCAFNNPPWSCLYIDVPQLRSCFKLSQSLSFSLFFEIVQCILKGSVKAKKKQSE